MKDILEKRIKLLAKCKESPELQAIETELCTRDILYFFREYLYTDKNTNLFSSDEPNVIPFIPFPFQEELITEVWSSIMNWTYKTEDRTDLTNVFIEKSRQMWVSRVIMWIFVYWWLFHDHKYHCISQKETDVDKPWDMRSLFEKARFMISNLPQWMLPKWFSKKAWTEYNKYMTIARPWSTWAITWESANPNASRSGTYNAVFLDEFAFQSNAATINGSAASATPCRIFNSTPNWEWNEHYRMRKLTERRKDVNWEDIAPEVKWLRYHWTDHPLYDMEWYKRKTKGMDKQIIAQELEIDYNTAIIWRVYDNFPTEPVNISYDSNKPLYIAIDNSHWWTDPNAVIVAQPDWIYWNIIDYVEFNSTPEDSAYFLRGTPKMQVTDIMNRFMERYKTYNYKKAIFISDPYDTKSAMWNSTILDDYRKVWINLVLPSERSKQEQILKTRTNLYRLRYNDNCLDFASCILNAKYPERKEDSNNTKPNILPIHNWTSHARTALEYFVTYMLENPVEVKKRIVEDTRPRRKFTWELVYSRPT